MHRRCRWMDEQSSRLSVKRVCWSVMSFECELTKLCVCCDEAVDIGKDGLGSL